MRPELHNCGLVRCTACQKYVNWQTHQCYMQPEKTKVSETVEADQMLDEEAWEATESVENESTYNQLIFFDFEYIQENGTHVPNLCVVHDEAGNEHVFKGESTS